LSTQGNNPDPTVLAAFNAARQDLKHSAGNNASYLVYIGIGMLVCTYTYMLVWQWTGEVNAKRVRERYLQAVLRQDIAYFDELGAGEVATRIETDTHLVHSGIAEKVPTAVQYISTFITGFVCKLPWSFAVTVLTSPQWPSLKNGVSHSPCPPSSSRSPSPVPPCRNS
jgi:ATP-binding cassette subfamily B (MDR/TAP) protein 1